jgi:hypothetical protein
MKKKMELESSAKWEYGMEWSECQHEGGGISKIGEKRSIDI